MYKKERVNTAIEELNVFNSAPSLE